MAFISDTFLDSNFDKSNELGVKTFYFLGWSDVLRYGIRNMLIRRGESVEGRITLMRDLGHQHYYFHIDDYKFFIKTVGFKDVVCTQNPKEVYKRLLDIKKQMPVKKKQWPEAPLISNANETCIDTYIFDYWKAIDKIGGSKGFGNRGMIFCGPPGTGKSTTMKYIADVGQQLFKLDVFKLGVSDFMKIIDSGQDLPSEDIILIDDIDANILMDRRITKNPYTSKLLSCLDGIDKQSGRVILVSTNEPIDNIDPALKRAGRLSKTLIFDLPSDSMVNIFCEKNDLKDPHRFYGRTLADIDEFVCSARIQNALYGTDINDYYNEFEKHRFILKEVESEYKNA